MPEIIPVEAFSDNYIWILRAGRHAVVVDPGDATPVLRWLDASGSEPAAILATHHHGDHVDGIPELTARREVPVYGPPSEDIPGRTHGVATGTRVVLDALGIALSVLDIPGHTAGHVAYVAELADGPVAFVGDTLFAGGCGRVFEGTPVTMAASLARLASLPGQTRVYCAHEYTLANLRFALAVEPGNAALRQREAVEAERRRRGEPTVPTTIEVEPAAVDKPRP